MTLEIRDAELEEIKVGSIHVREVMLFHDINLNGAEFKSVQCGEASFYNSNFDRVMLHKCSLSAGFVKSTFRRCEFSGGKMTGSFIDCTFDNVDMRQVFFEGASFFHMDRIQTPQELPRLPERPDNFLCASWTLLDVIDELRPRVARRTHKWMDMMQIFRKNPANAEYLLIDPSFFLGETDEADIPLIMKALYANRARQE